MAWRYLIAWPEIAITNWNHCIISNRSPRNTTAKQLAWNICKIFCQYQSKFVQHENTLILFIGIAKSCKITRRRSQYVVNLPNSLDENPSKDSVKMSLFLPKYFADSCVRGNCPHQSDARLGFTDYLHRCRCRISSIPKQPYDKARYMQNSIRESQIRLSFIHNNLGCVRRRRRQSCNVVMLRITLQEDLQRNVPGPCYLGHCL